MGRYSLRQLCSFVVACGVYFGGIPHMYFVRLRGHGADDVVAFASGAVLAWLLLAAVYVYWRQLTPLAVHCLRRPERTHAELAGCPGRDEACSYRLSYTRTVLRGRHAD